MQRLCYSCMTTIRNDSITVEPDYSLVKDLKFLYKNKSLFFYSIPFPSLIQFPQNQFSSHYIHLLASDIMAHPSRFPQGTPIIPDPRRDFPAVLDFNIGDIRISSVMNCFRDLHSAAKVGLLTEFYNIIICYYKANGLFFLPHDLDNIVKLFTDVHIMSVTVRYCVWGH